MPAQRIAPVEKAELYKEVLCPCFGATETNQAIELVLRAGIPADYIAPRLKIYDAAVMHYQAEKLLAFQLVQQFTAGPGVFIYFGPAFSKGGALLQLYAWYIKELHRKFPEKDIFILAEIQNPNMLMVLHGLFGEFGYSFITENIPADILKMVPLFCRRYSHIGRYNPGNFTTSSAYSLFKENRTCQALSECLIRNQISLAGGDNMLFAARIPENGQQRNAVLQQVAQGIDAVRNWGEFKNAFLNRLKQSAR